MLQYSQPVLNAKLDAIEATIGVSALLKFYSGAMPANCAAAATGVLLGSTALPADWLAAAGCQVQARRVDRSVHRGRERRLLSHHRLDGRDHGNARHGDGRGR